MAVDISQTTPRINRKYLQQVVAGLADGVILIEPNHSIAWANDAALAMHGVSDLSGLGATAEGYHKIYRLRYRNHHMLRPDQYPVERVLAGQTFTNVVVEVMHTVDDEFNRTHQVRGLVLADDNGDPEQLVLVMKDVTERFSAEVRFEKAFGANPAPALICRLSDLRYVKVNEGFLGMTGYARDEVIGRSTYELDVFEQAMDRDQCIAALNAGVTISQTEAVLQLSGGGGKFIIVAGQPIDMNEEACMLFTFIDLDPRKKVEDALRHTEERFSKAFRLAPVPMMVISLDGPQLLEVNDAFSEVMGYAVNDVSNMNISEMDIWGNEQAWSQLVVELESAKGLRNREMLLHTRDGVVINCLVSADTVTIGGQSCVLCVMQDVTDRKRSEVELVSAVEAVMQDTSWFSHMLLEKLAKIRHPGTLESSVALKDLTQREREVLGLICQGLGDEEIARRLHLSRHTIRNHIATLYSKIDVHRRAAAIVWARERGITD